ncbi:MAG: hypothetical protein ABTQ28_08765, partial [Thauera sp.]
MSNPLPKKPRARQRGMLRRPVFALAAIACLLTAVYWGLIASDRYVSQANIIIQRTDMAGGQSMDFSSLLSGSSGGSRPDQMLLRDHLLSVDMLRKLDEALGLRAHYSSSAHDFLSRMWSAAPTIEEFHRYYLSRVSVEFDEYAGVLVIRAQGYDPKTAQAITRMLVDEGERKMNALAHDLASEQVAFLEKQVEALAERAIAARQKVLAYQNQYGLLSPQGTAESLAGVVNKLEGQLTELRARKAALLGYLAPTAPGVVEVDLQIDAVDQQIKKEQLRLASPKGKALNRAVEEFQRLELEAGFAQDMYKTALVALEKGRVEATRTLKKVSVLQSPT